MKIDLSFGRTIKWGPNDFPYAMPCYDDHARQSRLFIFIVICVLNWETPRGLFVTRKSNSLCSSNWICNRNETTIEIMDSNKFLSSRAKSDTVSSTSHHWISFHVLAFISFVLEGLFFIFFEVLSLRIRIKIRPKTWKLSVKIRSRYEILRNQK